MAGPCDHDAVMPSDKVMLPAFWYFPETATVVLPASMAAVASPARPLVGDRRAGRSG